MKSKSKFFPVLLMLFLFTGCTTWFDFNKLPTSGKLYGMIYYLDRQPAKGASVRVQIKGKNDYKEYSCDVNGRFTTEDFDFGPLVLTVEAEKAEPKEIEILFSSSSNVFYTQVIHERTLLTWAKEALLNSEWGKAEGFIERVNKIQPDNAEASFLEAVLLFRRGKPEEAVLILRQLHQNFPNSVGILLLLAEIFEADGKSSEQVLEYLEKALVIKWDEKISRKIELIKAEM